MNAKEKLLRDIYFNPSTCLLSSNKIYKNVKDEGLAMREVKYFHKQQLQQVFRQVKPTKIFFPITTGHKFQLLQADFVDMLPISANNNNINFLFICVDVFSRMMFVSV